MKGKVRVGVLFCGGCNCYFDRQAVYEALQKEYEDVCSFFIYSPGGEVDADLIVLINGCTSECLMDETYPQNLLVIHNLNYQEASSLLGTFVHDIFAIKK